MTAQIIKATVKYDDEQKAWRWWVGLIDGPAITSHAYYGDDGEVGRCYCGRRTYPTGGREVQP